MLGLFSVKMLYKSLVRMIISAQVIEMSTSGVTNSPSENYTHLDDCASLSHVLQ